MRRRGVLVGSAGLVSIGLAGCLSQVTSTDTARIAELGLYTQRGDPTALDVMVTVDEEVLFDESFELASDSSSDLPSSRILKRPWMRESAQFELTIDTAKMDEPVTRQIPNEGSGCYVVSAVIRPNGVVQVPMYTDDSEC